jgi:hypothetical protein
MITRRMFGKIFLLKDKKSGQIITETGMASMYKLKGNCSIFSIQISSETR